MTFPFTIPPEMLNQIMGAIGFLFTLLVFSYVLGDGPLFRIAIYIFVGVSAGYVAAVAWWQVIVPRLVYPLMSALASGSPLDLGVSLALSFAAILLLMKASPSFSGMGRIVVAFLVGVGAAVTLAGALIGTLIPQVSGTIYAFDMTSVETIASSMIILAGATLTLAYFHFGARPTADGSMRRFGLIEILAWGGRIFIGIALGAIFAGVYAAALTALIERISSLINFVMDLIGNFL
ncbi:MAG: hypothetical protein HY865_26830 [Chloroflexi bacterium]|nr:hypothetical protein [Chloroflexota bacterium]